MPRETMITSPPPPLRPDDALFLDFDGTLVPIAAKPHLVRPRPDLPEALARLARALDGALAVVTGRPLDQVDAFLAPLRLTGAGLHGLEQRVDATIERPAPPPSLRRVVERLAPFAAAHAPLLLEDKGLAVALHYRGAPELGDRVRAAVADAVRGEEALDVLDGKAILEVRPRGVDKGVGVRRLLERAPFAGRRPVFAGDDTTDEDAHAAVVALGGVAIKVGAGPTVARHRVADQEAFLDWLFAQAGALDGGVHP